jgi:hypothetical protein
MRSNKRDALDETETPALDYGCCCLHTRNPTIIQRAVNFHLEQARLCTESCDIHFEEL